MDPTPDRIVLRCAYCDRATVHGKPPSHVPPSAYVLSGPRRGPWRCTQAGCPAPTEPSRDPAARIAATSPTVPAKPPSVPATPSPRPRA